MTVQTGVRTRAPGYAQLISWTTNSAISRTTLVTTQRCSQKCTGRSLWILRLNLEGSAGKYWLYSPLVCCSLCVWWYVCTGLCVRRHLYGCSLAVVILNSTSSSKLSRSCDCAPCKKKKKKSTGDCLREILPERLSCVWFSRMPSDKTCSTTVNTVGSYIYEGCLRGNNVTCEGVARGRWHLRNLLSSPWALCTYRSYSNVSNS